MLAVAATGLHRVLTVATTALGLGGVLTAAAAHL